MITIQAKGVSKGIAIGPLHFLHRPAEAVAKGSQVGADAEKARLKSAREAAIAQLNTLAQQCRGTAAEDMASLFETHALFVEDEDFLDAITGAIEKENCTAEYAVQQAGEQYAAMFAAMEDSYMQARAADIRDVAQRLVNNLTGAAREEIRSDVPVILAADDLTPSETVQLDKTKLLGFVTRGGSGNSHTAILARALGIPAICCVGEAMPQVSDGLLACIDGETGQLIMAPDPVTLAAFQEKYARQEKTRHLLEAMKGQPDVTADGRKIKLYCNITSPEDLPGVLANDGRGIGLFRSEFLYLRSVDCPTEEEQFQAYRDAAAAMKGMPVIIRTLDIGADKQVAYLGLKQEANPALGLRGVRVCLQQPELFRTQLRALYRASAFGKIAIMFPMITSVWEVEECCRACRRVMEELTEEGIPFDPDVQIGIMIETPASVLIAEKLAKLVDFFSVGTNDLTQYILACDRQAGDLERVCDPHHPAVLRALKMAADAAHAAGIWIGICGELASDLSLLPTFLAMGIDELSVNANAILPLRSTIRNCNTQTCTLELLD